MGAGPVESGGHRSSTSVASPSVNPGGRAIRRLGRSLKRRPPSPEFVLVSFPKCGRATMRDLLAAVVSTTTVTVSREDEPSQKTPAELERSKSAFGSRRVIFGVRDLRTAVPQLYRTAAERNWFDGSMSEFLHAERGSVTTMVAYYDIWAAQRETPKDILLVRYEDVAHDPMRAA